MMYTRAVRIVGRDHDHLICHLLWGDFGCQIYYLSPKWRTGMHAGSNLHHRKYDRSMLRYCGQCDQWCHPPKDHCMSLCGCCGSRCTTCITDHSLLLCLPSWLPLCNINTILTYLSHLCMSNASMPSVYPLLIGRNSIMLPPIVTNCISSSSDHRMH